MAMPVGGRREGAGRKRGGKNKRTVELELATAREIDSARISGRELAKDVLDRLMRIAEGAASLHKPNEAGQGGDWSLFGESPQLRAVVVSMPGSPVPEPKVVEGKVLNMKDPRVVAAAYVRLVKTTARS
jgi:hypothetical protein